MTTDISQKGLESLIVRHMVGTDGLAVAQRSATSRLVRLPDLGRIIP